MKTILLKLKYIVPIAYILLGICTSCISNFDNINTDPNKPTNVTSSMLATKVILDHVMPSGLWNSEFLSKRLISGEGIDLYQYNSLSKGDFNLLQKLTNASKMMEIASDSDKEAYTGLFYYLKAWAFFHTSLQMGDIPYNEALNIEMYRYPVYDDQKDLFEGVLNDLKQADTHFANANDTFEGDPVYGGNTLNWRKATNALRLKILMSLQKRAEDTPDLQIKQTFAQIVKENTLFESNADNLQIVFANKSGQENPMHVTQWRAMETYPGSETLINPLKQYKDYRLFYYFAPIQALTDPLYLPEGETLLERNDWNAYIGLDPTAPISETALNVSTKMYNRVNDIYRTNYVGIPVIRLGYADMNFTLAEAVERGWINGSAKEYYEKGIRASFDFVRSTVPNEDIYTQGMIITDDYINEYLNGPDVSYKLSGSMKERLEQIWMQTYLASFFHLQWESYFEYRRTGNPKLPINSETNLNEDRDKIPMRWLYPQNEINYNKQQMDIALQRQWNGVDNINNIMWIIK